MGFKGDLRKKVEGDHYSTVKTSKILQSFLDDKLSHDGNINLDEVFSVLKHRGFGLLFIFFGIIGVLALPPLSAIAAIPLITLSYQFFRDFDTPSFPRFIQEKEFERSSFRVAIEKAIKFAVKIEKYIKPRYPVFFLPLSERIIGFLMVLFCCSIIIPLPMTNFLPSVAIIFIGFGMMEKDGVMTMIGLALGVLGWFVTAMVLLFGVKAIEAIF